MRAVTGVVTSSKAISLAKASSILSRFASAEIGARRDVTAYLRLAANGFKDLAQFHRELRRDKREIEQVEDVTINRKKKKKIKKERDDEGLRMGENADLKLGDLERSNEGMKSMVQVKVEVEEVEIEASEERRKKKKMKRKHLSAELIKGEAEDESHSGEKKKKRKIKVEDRV